MKTLSKIATVKSLLGEIRKTGKTIGFVPTMGTLHEGHLTLIRKSVEENDVTLCSIFVNPIQFNNPVDLEKYPRNLSADQKLLETAGCDFLFAPDEEEMYPKGRHEELAIDFGYLENILEGRYRPGHFKGVAIVVKKLFDIAGPCRAYFGKKDYQQLLIIRELVKKLSLPVEIIGCPIVRETDGLAMSSRNLRLTIREREEAVQISSLLFQIKKKMCTMTIEELRDWGIKKLQANPLFRVDYLEIVDKRTLHALTSWKEKENGMVCAAVYVGDVRLIDNLELF